MCGLILLLCGAPCIIANIKVSKRLVEYSLSVYLLSNGAQVYLQYSLFDRITSFCQTVRCKFVELHLPCQMSLELHRHAAHNCLLSYPAKCIWNSIGMLLTAARCVTLPTVSHN